MLYQHQRHCSLCTNSVHCIGLLAANNLEMACPVPSRWHFWHWGCGMIGRSSLWPARCEDVLPAFYDHSRSCGKNSPGISWLIECVYSIVIVYLRVYVDTCCFISLQMFQGMESTLLSGNVRRREKSLLRRLDSTGLCRQWSPRGSLEQSLMMMTTKPCYLLTARSVNIHLIIGRA